MPDERETIRDFSILYYNGGPGGVHSHGGTWTNTRWLGIEVLKCPLDLWVYQEIIYARRPELIIETGTHLGGSAFYMASVLDLIGQGHVLTIDNTHRAGLPQHGRISYLYGDSVAEETVFAVHRLARSADSIMVVLDSDHSKSHVVAELEIYSRFVTSGQYLIVEDTNINGNPVLQSYGPGPAEAVEEFLTTNRGFVRDPRCEKFLLTFNPGGYLHRQ